MTTNYQRGRAFEYRTRNALLKRGAAYVMRAAQSKGAIDLLALWPRLDGMLIATRESISAVQEAASKMSLVAEPWFVQCKYSVNGGGTISPAERRKLIALADEVCARPVLARPGKNGRGVQFIDLHTNEEIQAG